MEIEVARAHYRPKQITTLFVGESAPYSGAFFYYGNSAMTRHMQRAVELVLGASSNFLESFKAYGWYLDDLVLTPVNHLTEIRAEGKVADREKQPCGSYRKVSTTRDSVASAWHPTHCGGCGDFSG